MGFVPKHEGITGADLTGSSGTANRTYELTNENAVLAQMQFIIEGAILQANVDFTFDSGSNIVTFLNVVWDDQNISLDYFVDDETSTVSYLQGNYTLVGADLTGTDGTANRQLIFVTNKSIVAAQMQITVENAILTNGVDYTFNASTKIITFLKVIYDTDDISVDFMYDGNYYATTEQIAQYSGAGVEVQLEEIGTGNGSERSYDTDFGNIIDNSFILYYGAADSNLLTPLVEGTDYQISLDDGRIYLFSSGVTKVNGKKIYLSYTYSPKQSDSILKAYLPKAQAEVDKLTGNYWGSPVTRTEYFDGYDSGYPQTDRPFGTQIEEDPEFEVKYKGVQSITSVVFLDREGNVTSTPTASQIRYDEEGRVILGPTTIPNGKRNVKITYSAGYDSVPDQIQELAALIGGLMALVNISGGSYKDVSTYQLGRKSFSIGQVYVNIESSIRQMQTRIDSILEDMGPRYAIA